MQFQEVLTAFNNVKDFNSKGLLQLKDDTEEVVALRVLARFFLTLEESLSLIGKNITCGDLNEISKGAHKIAGSADLVGFGIFAERSRQISRQANVTKKITTTDLQNQIVNYFNDGKVMLGQMKLAFRDYKTFL